MYVATMYVCVATPTTHPAGSFREGSDKRRTITTNNRENRKEKSSLSGGRDGKRKKVIKQDTESKRNKEIERLGKYQVSQTREKQWGRAADKKRDMVQVRVETSRKTLVLNSTFSFIYQMISYIFFNSLFSVIYFQLFVYNWIYNIYIIILFIIVLL